MLSNKQPGPIRTYKTFFKACRTLQRYGFVFGFEPTVAKVYDDRNGRANAHCIWWRAPWGSYWNPIEVIHHVYYSTSSNVWTPAILARDVIGLPVAKYDELTLAYHEAEGHLLSLRERLCAALDLVEVPIHERPSYRRRKRRKKKCRPRSPQD